MKTTKRVLAVVLAALMLACMIPFAASAVTAPAKNVTITFTCPSSEKYTFDIYQLALLQFKENSNECLGTYEIKTTNTTVADDIKNGVSDNNKAKFLQDCDANVASLGLSAYSTFNSTGNNKTFTESVPAGIYYIKVTPDKDTNSTKANSSVFSLPYYDGTDWINTLDINLASKIADDTPTIDKTVKRAEDANWIQTISEYYDKPFQFRIVAKVTGSSTQKVEAYRIYDEQAAGLTFVQVDSVKLLASATATSGTALANTVVQKAANDDLPPTATFAVNISDPNELYAVDNGYVEVIYTAKVNKDAAIAAFNKNKATLQWKPTGASEWTTGPNDDADVYTYDITVIKVDNANTETKLANAVFMIFDAQEKAAAADKNSSNYLAIAKTGADGKGVFKKQLDTATAVNDKFTFRAGTYYIKEVEAPEGYNLSTEVTPVTIESDTATATSKVVTIKDSKNVLPNTGGAGTLVFTIVGISLILAAGVLFVIVMKKRSSK